MKNFQNKYKTRQLFSPFLISASIILICILTAGLGCNKKSSSSSTPSSSGGYYIVMKNSGFDPGTYTIPVNATINWINGDGMNHTVTSDSTLFDSGTIHSKNGYSHQFKTIGTFPYHCNISGMTAKIIVQ